MQGIKSLKKNLKIDIDEIENSQQKLYLQHHFQSHRKILIQKLNCLAKITKNKNSPLN